MRMTYWCSGNTAKERSGLTSSLKWPHESGHQAVGGADFSSARHHLTPVAVYLVWSLADANWWQHLFVLPLFGSWSSFFLSVSMSHELALSFPPWPTNVSLLDILSLTISNMIICSVLCVSSYYTLFFLCTLSACVCVSLSLSGTSSHILSSSSL